MRVANRVSLGVALFFLLGGIGMYALGEGGVFGIDTGFAPMDEAIGDTAGTTFKLIGVIWGGVGLLLVVLFLFIGKTASRVTSNIGITLSTAMSTARPQASVADELAKLAELMRKGLLSPDEWERAKELYLGKPPDRREADARLLDHLHQLFEEGGLSESEFNAKKWEILSRS